MASSPRIIPRASVVRRRSFNRTSPCIIPPRAQASRRCETQATLGGKPQAELAFRSLDPFRALREPDCRRRDEERPFRSEQKTVNKPKRLLDRKSPIQVTQTIGSCRVVLGLT